MLYAEGINEPTGTVACLVLDVMRDDRGEVDLAGHAESTRRADGSRDHA
jgi:hypothetical protein